MATPTQTQPYGAPGGNPYPTPASEPRQAPAQASFDKYCVIHIATTCDEHGVYVTKDSAEVIEVGWVVVDARDPALPEVCCRYPPCKQLPSDRRRDDETSWVATDNRRSFTTSQCLSVRPTHRSLRCARPSPPSHGSMSRTQAASAMPSPPSTHTLPNTSWTRTLGLAPHPSSLSSP